MKKCHTSLTPTNEPRRVNQSKKKNFSQIGLTKGLPQSTVIARLNKKQFSDALRFIFSFPFFCLLRLLCVGRRLRVKKGERKKDKFLSWEPQWSNLLKESFWNNITVHFSRIDYIFCCVLRSKNCNELHSVMQIVGLKSWHVSCFISIMNN